MESSEVEIKKDRFYSIQIIEKTFRSHLIEWSATALTIVGSVFNSNLLGIDKFNSYYYSFYLFFIANLLWVSFGFKHKHWGVFTTFSLLGIVNILAILKNLGII